MTRAKRHYIPGHVWHKNRKGVFWQDRYHATAVESNHHLCQCIAYIDMNMVRAGVVDHPEK
jgi:putative transposase